MRYRHEPGVSCVNDDGALRPRTFDNSRGEVESHAPNELIHGRQDRSKRCSATIAKRHGEPAFWDAAAEAYGAIDAAYHAKYDRSGPKIVGSVSRSIRESRDHPPRPARRRRLRLSGALTESARSRGFPTIFCGSTMRRHREKSWPRPPADPGRFSWGGGASMNQFQASAEIFERDVTR